MPSKMLLSVGSNGVGKGLGRWYLGWWRKLRDVGDKI